MTENPNLSFLKINEYLFTLEREKVDHFKKDLLKLTHCIHYDAAYLFLLDQPDSTDDYDSLGLLFNLKKQFIEYYLESGPDQMKKPTGVKTWYDTWKEFEDPEFIYDYAPPAKLDFTAGMTMFNEGIIPGVVVILPRSSKKDDGDSQFASLKFVQANLTDPAEENINLIY